MSAKQIYCLVNIDARFEVHLALIIQISYITGSPYSASCWSTGKQQFGTRGHWAFFSQHFHQSSTCLVGFDWSALDVHSQQCFLHIQRYILFDSPPLHLLGVMAPGWSKLRSYLLFCQQERLMLTVIWWFCDLVIPRISGCQPDLRLAGPGRAQRRSYTIHIFIIPLSLLACYSSPYFVATAGENRSNQFLSGLVCIVKEFPWNFEVPCNF